MHKWQVEIIFYHHHWELKDRLLLFIFKFKSEYQFFFAQLAESACQIKKKYWYTFLCVRQLITICQFSFSQLDQMSDRATDRNIDAKWKICEIYEFVVWCVAGWFVISTEMANWFERVNRAHIHNTHNNLTFAVNRQMNCKMHSDQFQLNRIFRIRNSCSLY